MSVTSTQPPELLIDTSSLITLNTDKDLWNLVKQRFANRAGTSVAVCTELESLRRDRKIGDLVNLAMNDLGWLGTPIPVDDDAGRERVQKLRELITGARPLLYPMHHLGESTLITIAETSGQSILMEDHDARVNAKGSDLESFSTHKLLHQLIKLNVISVDQAFNYCEAIRARGRGLDYTRAELREGRLARVGQP